MPTISSIVGGTHEPVRHLAPGGKRHFTVLEMEAGIREQPEFADVIVMRAGDDNLLKLGASNSDNG